MADLKNRAWNRIKPGKKKPSAAELDAPTADILEEFSGAYGHPLKTCQCQSCETARWINKELGGPRQRAWPLLLEFKRVRRRAIVTLAGCPTPAQQNRVRGVFDAESALGPEYPSVTQVFLEQSFETPAGAVNLVKTYLGQNQLPADETDDEEERELADFTHATEE